MDKPTFPWEQLPGIMKAKGMTDMDVEKVKAEHWGKHFQDEFGQKAVSIARQDARAWNDLTLETDQHAMIWRAVKNSFPLHETEHKQDGWVISGLIGPDGTWRCDLQNVPPELLQLGIIGISFTNTRFIFFIADETFNNLPGIIETLKNRYPMSMGQWSYQGNEIYFMHPQEGHRINAYYFRYFVSMMAKQLNPQTFKLIVNSQSLDESEAEPLHKRMSVEQVRELETVPFSSIPPYVRQRVENISAQLLMKFAASGSRVHAALSINPAMWQEMFARDFPAEYKYYRGEVPFFIRFTERRLQQPNRWKRAYLWFVVKLKRQTNIPKEYVDNALHRKIWQSRQHYDFDWHNRYLFYKLMLTFPMDFTLHKEPYERLLLSYDAATQLKEQDFVSKNPLMMKLVRFVFLGEKHFWEDPVNFEHVIQLAIQTEQEPGKMIADFQNFCNLMNTTIPILYEREFQPELFNVWENFAQEFFFMIQFKHAKNLTSLQMIAFLFMTNEPLASLVGERLWSHTTQQQLNRLPETLAVSYDKYADVLRNDTGQILAKEIKF